MIFIYIVIPSHEHWPAPMWVYFFCCYISVLKYSSSPILGLYFRGLSYIQSYWDKKNCSIKLSLKTYTRGRSLNNLGLLLLLSNHITELPPNSNNNRSKPKLLRLLWDIVVFKLVAYLMNMIRLNLRFLYAILYI